MKTHGTSVDLAQNILRVSQILFYFYISFTRVINRVYCLPLPLESLGEFPYSLRLTFFSKCQRYTGGIFRRLKFGTDSKQVSLVKGLSVAHLVKDHVVRYNELLQ